MLAGVMLSPTFVGAALAHLEYVSNPMYAAIIDAGRILILVMGAALTLSGRSIAAPLIRLVIAGAIAGIGLGVYGAARHWEWVKPRTKTQAELQRWLTTGKAPYFSDWELRQVEARAARIDLDGKVSLATLATVVELGDGYLRHGRNQEAITLLGRALEAGQRSGHPTKALDGLRWGLALAYLRLGEVSHCIGMHRPSSCVYPVQGEGVWANPEAARSAAGQLLELLKNEPGHLGARWLLNIAFMVAGDPDGVPAQFKIAPRRDPSYREIRRFRDVAPDLGVASFNLAGGAILDDFDGDGWLDLITSSYGPNDSMRYLHNDRRGGFSDWSKKSRIADQFGGFNLYQADYDNDGRLDVLVLRGAWMQAYGRQRLSLLHQEADGTFSDVTDAAGLGDSAYPTLAAGWADYDNDGNLDLFVAYEQIIPGKTVRSALFHNDGHGHFRDVSREAGIDARGNFKSVAWGDYDNDGDQDLYLSNLGGSNLLYRNNGNGTFTEIGHALGVDFQPPNGKTFASWFFDYDNDGWLDLFVGGYGAESLDPFVADTLGLPAGAERLSLYRNDHGRFVDVTHEVGLDRVLMPMGANFGDFDHDGWPDIYLGTGRPGFEFLVPNVLFHNQRGKRFVDVTTAAGVGLLQKGHAIAFGDYDNDGDQDIFAEMGGFYPADRYASSLFENPGYGTHWISIRLIGARSNRAAIGARVRLSLTTPEGQREVHGRVGSGGSFGASTLRLELGLDTASRIAELEVRWPASGTRQLFKDVPADRFLEITEFAQIYRVLDDARSESVRGPSRR